MAGDAEPRLENELEPLESDRSVAVLAGAVGAGVESLECMSDVGDRILGPGDGGLGDLPLEDAVDIGLTGERAGRGATVGGLRGLKRSRSVSIAHSGAQRQATAGAARTPLAEVTERDRLALVDGSNSLLLCDLR